LSIEVKSRVGILLRGNQNFWNLGRVSDFDESVGMSSFLFTLLAEVEVVADDTFVAESDDWGKAASVASDMMVNNRSRRFLL